MGPLQSPGDGYPDSTDRDLRYLSNQLPLHHRGDNTIVKEAERRSAEHKQKKQSHSKPVEKKEFVPRQYQIDLFNRALERNTITVLETGAGKTLVAVMLIKEMVSRQRCRKELDPEAPHKVVIFLVNIVPLVFQQGELVKACIPYKVELLCGEMNVDFWKIAQWRDRIDSNDVLVMTAQIFLNMLRHAFISLDEVSLLVFDECHHTQKSHPYNMIMQEFYHRLPPVTKENPFARPKIFGMTASPLGSRIGAISAAGHLEQALDSYIFTINSYEELRNSVNKPKEISVGYDSAPDDYEIDSLIQIVHEHCSSSRIIQKLYEDALEVMTQLGPWCALLMFRRSLEELQGDKLSSDILFLDDNFTPSAFNLELSYIKQARDIYEAYLTKLANYEDPLDADPITLPSELITPKLTSLLQIIKKTDKLPSFCGIVFVERRCVARSVMLTIKHSETLGFIKPGCLLGHGSRQSIGNMRMNFTQQRNTINDFKSGKLNLMIATKVAEEGLDIQPCNIVIRFDFCSSLVSYIQSRGRARQKNSLYIVLQENGNVSEQSILKQLQRAEQEMNAWCNQLPEDRFRTSLDIDTVGLGDSLHDQHLHQSHVYRVPKTGAVITLESSIELLHRYCSVLPRDNYCDSKPHFDVQRQGTYYRCKLTLPANAALKLVEGELARSKVGACQSCAFKACVVFHLTGAIDDHLLPPKDSFDANDYDPVREYHGNGTVEGSWLATNEYWSKSPDFWQNDPPGWNQFYLNIIDTSAINDSIKNGLYIPLAIITRTPFPELNEIEIFIKGVATKLRIVTSYTPLENITTEHQSKLFEFTKQTFASLFHRTIQCEFDSTMYLVAPLKPLSYQLKATIHSVKLDWDRINYCLNPPSLSTIVLEDAIVCDTTDPNNRYYVANVITDLNPLSLIPALEQPEPTADELPQLTFKDYYSKYLKKQVTDLSQPVYEVNRVNTVLNYLTKNNNISSKKTKGRRTKYILPEFSKPYFFDGPTYRSLMLVPSLMMRIDSYLLIKEVKCNMNLPEVCDDLLLEAFTCTTANVAMDYERLELLGDSFLKFIASLDVFINYPLKHEGQLHCQRVRIIGNRTMYHAAKQRDLPKYFITEPFNRRTWRPPNVHFDGDSLEKDYRIHKRTLADKALADVVEASLGASLLAAGNSAALKCAVAFGIPLKKTLQWDELSNLAPNPNSEPDDLFRQQILDVSKIEDIIGYKFSNESLLVEAFTHASYPHAITPSYQRLEFLGDAVLDHFVVSYLFNKYPGFSPGVLTEMKDACVSNNTLAAIVEPLELHPHILHFSSKLMYAMDEFKTVMSELRLDWEANQSEAIKNEYWFDVDAPKVISDIMESIIGAVFVDSGFSLETAHGIFERLIQPVYDRHIAPNKVIVHPSVQLTRYAHRYGCQQLKFETNNLDPENAKLVEPALRASCKVTLHGESLGVATGVVVKAARKYACQVVIDRIRKNPDLFDPICNCPSRRTQPSFDDDSDQGE